MPEGTAENFDFAAIFDALYDWWTIFFSAERKDMVGKNGFVNFLNLNGLYDLGSSSHEYMGLVEKDVAKHLRVVLSLYRPDDVTLLPMLGKKVGVIDEKEKREAELDLWSIVPSCAKRKFCLVDGVHCGIGPQCTEVGDLVVVILGMKVPLVLRRRKEEDGGGYMNLGDSFIDGFMFGEAVKDLGEGKCESELFAIH
jgi:hypothetical protein